MQNPTHIRRPQIPIALLYAASGLVLLSLLVTWSVEQLAETLFLNY